jgi:hypothetical protein
VTHSETASSLERAADDVAMLKGRGDRFFVQRMRIERRLRELAGEVSRLDPERRRRSFQTGMIAVHRASKDGSSGDRTRMIPVRVRRARKPSPGPSGHLLPGGEGAKK